MNITINPIKISGKLNIIPFKSYLHRMIISACLSEGYSKIDNVYYSEDIKATINNLREIFDFELYKDYLIVDSSKRNFGIHNFEIKESGSTLRFLIPVLSYLNNFEEIKIKIGDTLKSRPFDEYKSLFECFKLKDDTLYIKGFIKQKEYHISTLKTSQIVSGLLFILPLFKENTTIYIDSLNSVSYIDKTIEVLGMYGVKIKRDDKTIFINGNQKYYSNQYYTLDDENFENYLYIINHFKKNQNKDYLISKIADDVLKYDTVDLSNNIDDTLNLAILALTKDSETKFTGIKNLKYKESNRIKALLDNFKTIKYEDDTLKINKGTTSKKIFDSYNDHRVVMMLTLYSIINDKKITINNFECINKSYPTYVSDLKKLGFDIKITEDPEILSYKVLDKTSKIIVDKDFLNKINNFIDDNDKKVVIITEKNIPKEIIDSVKANFKNLLVYISNKTHENIKSINEYTKIIDFLLDHNISKSDYLIGVGGGVISDTVGFVAKTYKRGINYSIVSTSLIGMIDASIGGKCGINTKTIKNSIGDYNYPEYVFIDLNLLKTLPLKELKSGMAELIKIALISSKELFFDIYDSAPYEKIDKWIKDAIKEKIKFVNIDPFDKLERHALNYGHTYGHIIELKEKIPHGIAVAKGITLIDKNEYIDNMFKKYKIDTTINYEVNELDKLILNDKKIENGILKIVKLDNIGNYKIENKEIWMNSEKIFF